jgi:hypothetical protein
MNLAKGFALAVAFASTSVGCGGGGEAARKGPESVREAEFAMRELGDAVDMSYLDTRGLPLSLEDLLQPSKKTGEPLLAKIPLDPWGSPYIYKILNAARREYEVVSLGPDKVPSEDDLRYPPREK